jgi:lipopolysaccharide biosynthesis regulator YciM
MLIYLFLLLPMAAASGWFAAVRNQNKSSKQQSKLPRDYLIGLNLLLNEEPDKAVDIFIKMLEVDSDTVETHLALGHLFRRRGEVDRAIRIHQNLIARPHLSKSQRTYALLSLGQDYMRAGMLDRAERIFLEVVENGGEQTSHSLRFLLSIYQQEKAWEKAISLARKIESATGESKTSNISHYYCELALECIAAGKHKDAKKLLRKAINVDPQCVRASLIQGDLEFVEGRFKIAIRFYQQVKLQDPAYLSESLKPLVNCYQALKDEQALILYFQECLKDNLRISLVLCLADLIQKSEGEAAAIHLIANYLHIQPSIRGLKRLVELQLLHEEGESKNLHLLSDLIAAMLNDKPIYRCGHCGFSAKKIHWLCPGCKTWNSVKPIHGLEGD